MRFNNRAFSEAEQLTRLVAIDTDTTGFIKDIEGWRVIAKSGVKVDRTGDTNEAIMGTIAIPAGAMGPNGALRITTTWSCTNSANNKTPRIRLGGISGSQILAATFTTQGAHIQRLLQNRGSAASQISSFGASSANSFTNASPATFTVDTSIAQDLVITGQLALGSETLSLESYLVELAYGA